MTVNKKDRKVIIDSWPQRSAAELAQELNLKPAEVEEVLVNAGVKTDSSGSALGRTRPRVFVFALLATVICLVYLNSVRNGFHYDDIHSLLQNLGVRVEWTRNPESRSLFYRYFIDPTLFSSRPQVAMPRPILMVTFGLNYMISRYDAWSWVLVNIFLHIVNTSIIYLALCHLTGRQRFALLTALIWAVHPVNTETVNYINCRSESLSVLFMLLTMYFFTRSLLEKQRWGLRAAAFSTFTLSLLTKELGITTFGMVMVIDLLLVWPAEKSRDPWGTKVFRRALGWYAPLVGIVIAYMFYRMAVLDTAVVKAAVRPWGDNFLIQMRALVQYLWMFVFPTRLNISHENLALMVSIRSFINNPFVVMTGNPPFPLLLAILLLAGLLGFGLYLLWTGLYSDRPRPVWRPLVAFAILNFFVTLSITSLVPLNALMNEHRLYLPSLGAAMLLAALLEYAAAGQARKAGRSDGWWPVPVQVMAVVIILLYSGLTIARNYTWYTDFTVWRDSVTKSPLKAQVVSDLGNAYYRTGRMMVDRGEVSADGSIDESDRRLIKAIFREEVPVGPITPEVNQQLRQLFLRGLNRAELLYMWGIRVEPDYFKAWHNLGTINYTYAQIAQQQKNLNLTRQQLERAVYFFEGAIRISPNGESFNDMASSVLQLAGLAEDQAQKEALYRKAEELYTNGVRYNPEMCKGFSNLGMIKSRLRKPQEALQYLNASIQCDPLDPQPYYLIGYVHNEFNLGRTQAISILQKCLEVSPGYSPCQQELQKAQGGGPIVPNAPTP